MRLADNVCRRPTLADEEDRAIPLGRRASGPSDVETWRGGKCEKVHDAAITIIARVSALETRQKWRRGTTRSRRTGTRLRVPPGAVFLRDDLWRSRSHGARSQPRVRQ